ncbi:hypothetical protein [Oscillatoria sp. FACHB-1406]|uniref:hypothetical protein n=1 Tax=Oscillatoria sp. FACHB-1406 TaxID=2692846 RepID=UPI0016870C21|nr:hypothetical protein [Oscillatoria sp. FACHB-1406]MBD2578102.1 hypothetical protein [Oscillatoria sp. FACHB-1406]
MTEFPLDPLNSPHPIPWNWVLANAAELSMGQDLSVRLYRSSSLISPDGQYAAYSRLQMQAEVEFFTNRVTSVLFLENLQTGDLQTIAPSSPLASNPFGGSEDAELPGTISIAIPISWSESGDRLLARQFEGLFNTSEASDYAVIWDRRSGTTATVAPEGFEYTNAILLGWSQNDPSRVLFQAGSLGEEDWPLWSVGSDSQTLPAEDDRPIVRGQVVNYAWTGAQGEDNL